MVFEVNQRGIGRRRMPVIRVSDEVMQMLKQFGSDAANVAHSLGLKLSGVWRE